MGSFFNRHSNDSKDKIDPYGYLTFGTGPRACIGAYLSISIMKLALVEILQHFSFVPCKETDVRKIFLSFPTVKTGMALVCDCLVRLSAGLPLWHNSSSPRFPWSCQKLDLFYPRSPSCWRWSPGNQLPESRLTDQQQQMKERWALQAHAFPQ